MCRQQCTGFFPAALQIFVPGVFTLNILLYSIPKYCVFSQLPIAKASILWANQSRESKHSAIWINGIIHSCKWMSQERWKKHVVPQARTISTKLYLQSLHCVIRGCLWYTQNWQNVWTKMLPLPDNDKGSIFSLSAKIKICTLSMQGFIPSLTTSHKK